LNILWAGNVPTLYTVALRELLRFNNDISTKWRIQFIYTFNSGHFRSSFLPQANDGKSVYNIIVQKYEICNI